MQFTYKPWQIVHRERICLLDYKRRFHLNDLNTFGVIPVIEFYLIRPDFGLGINKQECKPCTPKTGRGAIKGRHTSSGAWWSVGQPQRNVPTPEVAFCIHHVVQASRIPTVHLHKWRSHDSQRAQHPL